MTHLSNGKALLAVSAMLMRYNSNFLIALLFVVAAMTAETQSPDTDSRVIEDKYLLDTINKVASENRTDPNINYNTLPNCTATPQGPFSDVCFNEIPVKKIFTLDLKLKPEYTNQEDVYLEIPYEMVRTSGAVIQLYYSGVVGKAQWFTMA